MSYKWSIFYNKPFSDAPVVLLLHDPNSTRNSSDTTSMRMVKSIKSVQIHLKQIKYFHVTNYDRINI